MTPLRSQIEMPPEKPGFQIFTTLENLETGYVTELKDSLLEFNFPSGRNALNAWAAMKLAPHQTYRLKAKRADGAASSVTVTTPGDFPTPRFEVSEEVPVNRLFITGTEHLVDVQSRWFYRIFYAGEYYNKRITIPYRDRVEEVSPGTYTLTINPNSERRRVLEQLTLPASAEAQLLGRQIFTAVAGPDWNDDILSLDDLRYALPDVASNVENRVGYVIGIVSKSIPYKSCFDDEENYISCPEEQPIF